MELSIKGKMREQFLNKLKSDQRTFKWFFDQYIKDKRKPLVAYNTLYQQAKGEFLQTMDVELKKAITEYLEEK